MRFSVLNFSNEVVVIFFFLTQHYNDYKPLGGSKLLNIHAWINYISLRS